MKQKHFLIFGCLLSCSSLALASPEDAYYDGNSVGSAGWDLGYGLDEELDQETEEQKARRLWLLEEQKRKQRELEAKQNDFFADDIEAVDKGMSRTLLQDDAVKGNLRD